jgi:hypothetical protein
LDRRNLETGNIELWLFVQAGSRLAAIDRLRYDEGGSGYVDEGLLDLGQLAAGEGLRTGFATEAVSGACLILTYDPASSKYLVRSAAGSGIGGDVLSFVAEEGPPAELMGERFDIVNFPGGTLCSNGRFFLVLFKEGRALCLRRGVAGNGLPSILVSCPDGKHLQIYSLGE